MSTMIHSPQFFISIPSNQRFSLTIHYPNLHLNPSLSFNSIITCARTNTNNKGFFPSKHQSRKLSNTLFHLLRFTATHLPYMVPEPFNSIIQEFSSGSGSGSGGGYGGKWKGFGWGGFDGGGGGGRKRRVNKKSQFWLLGFAVACCLGFWWLKNDVVLGGICLLMFLVLVRNGCVPEWVLGFCGGGVVVGVLGDTDKRGELDKFVNRGFKMIGVSTRQRRRRS